MKTEWEKLEKLSKDELIIELVKAKWEKKNLQKVIMDLAENMGSYNLFACGEKPPEDWQKKIVNYVFTTDDFHNLQEWGVDEDTANKLYDEYYDEDGKRRQLNAND